MTSRRRFRLLAAGLLAALLLPLLALAAPSAISPAGAQGSGAVVIMGIDAEEGGPNGHGPITSYEQIVSAVMGSVTNGNSGIAVMGGGAGTNVESFWNQISTDLGIPVTYFVGADAIANADIADFAIVVISSSIAQTSSGGINDADNDVLTSRAFELVDLVNGGGGLIGFSQDGLSTQYAYMGDFGTFVGQGVPQFSDITPTPEGEAVGITSAAFDGQCCWHDEFTEWPSFLQVLATHTSTGEAIALGGFDVAIPTGCVLEPAALSIAVGDPYTATARATEGGSPAVGIPVVFEVIDGPNAGLTGNATTDANGAATFSFTSSATGVDQVAAAFTDSQGRVRNCNLVTVEWVPAPPTTVTVAPVTPVAQAARLTPAFTG
jgi:hypothetical protein